MKKREHFLAVKHLKTKSKPLEHEKMTFLCVVAQKTQITRHLYFTYFPRASPTKALLKHIVLNISATSFFCSVFFRSSKNLLCSSEDFCITLFISFTPLMAFSICPSRYFSPWMEISVNHKQHAENVNFHKMALNVTDTIWCLFCLFCSLSTSAQAIILFYIS